MRCAILLSASCLFALAACGGQVTTASSGAGEGGSPSTASTGAAGTTTSGNLEELAACDAPAQCVLIPAGCCPACGLAELFDFVAVNAASAEAAQKVLCPEPSPCPDCAHVENPNLFVYCDKDQGRCVGADVRAHAVSACQSSEECVLRGGAHCCEDCLADDASEVTSVSLSVDPSLSSIVCEGMPPCPPCAPPAPGGVIPECGEDGHCKVFVIDK